jgi:hypothetical protein
VLVRQPKGLVLHRLVWGPPFDFGGAWRTMADRASHWDPRFEPAQWLATVCGPEDFRGGVTGAARAVLSLSVGLFTRLRGMFTR